MKALYDACQKALDYAKDRNTTGTIGALIEADTIRERLVAQARSRLELSTAHHLETYFRTAVRACLDFWCNKHEWTFLELVRDQGMLSSTAGHCSRAVPWDKTVTRGSLAHRWKAA